jgi:hypothetical protein
MRKLLTLWIALLFAALCSQSSAQFKGGGGFGTPGFTSPAASGGGGGTLTFTPTATATAWQTSISPPATFSSVSIGTASSDRVVVVVISVDGNATNGVISGVSIGGSTATQAAKLDPTGTIKGVYIYYLKVTTGTTANIVISCSGFPSGIGIAVGIITGSATTALGTPATSDQWTTPQADPHSITATVPTNGVGVVAVTVDRAITPVWINATADAHTNEGAGNALDLLMAHTTNNSPSFTGANNFGVLMASAPFGQ